jgi:hypothetical protein
MGGFGAMHEIAAGELVALPIEHPLFVSAKTRLLMRVGRPLGSAAAEIASLDAGKNVDVQGGGGRLNRTLRNDGCEIRF